jgi:hypothetical protein
MASLCLGFFFSLNLFLPGCKDDDNAVQPQASTSPFVGSWKLVVFNGTPASGVNIVWTFSDTTVVVTTPMEPLSGIYSYNPHVEPMTIDLRIRGWAPYPNLAIYKFGQQDTLVLKLLDGATTRATNFSVEQTYALYELKKQ